MDWKDALSSLKDSGTLPEGADAPQKAAGDADKAPEATQKKGKLSIFYERKGRAGKEATIIDGFNPDNGEALDTARLLKQRLGCGGSARGSEILLQGDRRAQLPALLRSLGYKI